MNRNKFRIIKLILPIRAVIAGVEDSFKTLTQIVTSQSQLRLTPQTILSPQPILLMLEQTLNHNRLKQIQLVKTVLLLASLLIIQKRNRMLKMIRRTKLLPLLWKIS